MKMTKTPLGDRGSFAQRERKHPQSETLKARRIRQRFGLNPSLSQFVVELNGSIHE